MLSLGVKKNMANKKVCLDPGHGGRDPGAVGPSGLKEKEVNLAVAKEVAKLLGTMAQVKLTRENDTNLGSDKNSDLLKRALIANDYGADCFVSIHCNAAADKAAHGFEVWTTTGQTPADTLATMIIDELKAIKPALTLRMDMKDGDPDKEKNFSVLYNTKMPAVLVELGFISNPDEERLLRSRGFQSSCAFAIAKGISKFLGMRLQPEGETKLPPDVVTVKVFGKTLTGKLIDGVSYAPVRALSEALGRKVRWDEKTRTVCVE